MGIGLLTGFTHELTVYHAGTDIDEQPPKSYTVFLESDRW